MTKIGSLKYFTNEDTYTLSRKTFKKDSKIKLVKKLVSYIQTQYKKREQYMNVGEWNK